MDEYQVYYNGRYLATEFCDSDEEARMKIAERISVTKIPITDVNSIEEGD